jgi:hypothetical protein
VYLVDFTYRGPDSCTTSCAEQTAPGPDGAVQRAVCPRPSEDELHQLERGRVVHARTHGFQGGFLFGAALPGGSGARGVALSELSGPQFEFRTELGAKVGKSLFVGGVFSIGIGSPADSLSSECSACATSGRLGLGPSARYYVSPEKPVDPWLSLGIEFSLLSLTNGGTSSSGDLVLGPQLRGVDLVLGAGLDWRISPSLGIGPYLDLALGSYSQAENLQPFSSATHFWTSIGMRFVLLP